MATPVEVSLSTQSAPLTASLTSNALEQHKKGLRRRRQMEKKMRHFFGQTAPLDKSVQDVEAKGVDCILESNIPLTYFLYYLMETYRIELLFFYLEVEDFQEFAFDGVDRMKKIARDIYNNFIPDRSDFQVNIDDSVRKGILPAVEDGDIHCFQQALEQVKKLLEIALAEFKAHAIWKRMKDEIGDSGSVYDVSKRNLAIKLLLSKLDVTLNDEATALKSRDPEKIARQRRNYLTRILVHSFCRTRLHVKIHDYPDGTDLPKPPPELLSVTFGNSYNAF